MTRSIVNAPCRVAVAAMLTATLLLAVTAMARAETADETALRGAAGDEKRDEVERLLDKGTDPNVPDHDGWTAVHHAAAKGGPSILSLLLMGRGDPNVKDVEGNTPLHLVAVYPFSEGFAHLSVKWLLSFRASPDEANNHGQTPLHLLARTHRTGTSMSWLMGAGADPGKADHQGDTPLHYAVDRDSKLSAGVVEALVDGGADGNVRGGSGETPLQLFVRVGSNDGRIVDALVEASADVNAKNPDGESPLHTAIRAGGSSENNRVVEALLAAGADPCIKDASGYIPYNTAREGGEVHTMLANAGGSDSDCQGAEVPVADYVVDPANWPGELTTRANIRSGPGTDHDVVSTLDGGTPVHVTGAVRNTDWLRVDVAGETAFVHASLVEKIETATEMETAQTMPDEDTTRRVANRMARCLELDRELTSLAIVGLIMDYPDTALSIVEEKGGPVEAAEEYMNACIPVQDRLLEFGWEENNCGSLARDIAEALWAYPSEWLAQPNDALERLEAAGARHLGEEYLQACVPVYAAAIDGRPVDDEAVQIVAEVEENAAPEEASGVDAAVASIDTQPRCREIQGDVPHDMVCWWELTQPSGCFFRGLAYQFYERNYSNLGPGKDLTWSGACEGGVATGEGTITWTQGGLVMESRTGQLVDGVRQGHWVENYDLYQDYFESVSKGPYVDGVRQGHWTHHTSAEHRRDSDEGPYVGGRRNGSWLLKHWNPNYGDKVSCNDAEYDDGDQTWASPPYWC